MIHLPLVRGQRLWFVPSGIYAQVPRWVTVTRTGIKWAYLDEPRDARLNIDTGKYEGPGGKFYNSPAEHTLELSVRHRWSQFTTKIREQSTFGRMPKGITLKDIEDAIKILKLDEE